MKKRQRQTKPFNPYAPSETSYRSSTYGSSESTSKTSQTTKKKAVSPKRTQAVSKKTKTVSAKGTTTKGQLRATKTRPVKDTEIIRSLPPELRRQEIKKRNQMTKAQLIRNKERKKKRFIKRVVLLMVFTVFGVWGIFTWAQSLVKPSVSTQIVKLGTLDLSESFEGMIIRNEQVYYSEEEGSLQYNVVEGEKIKKDGIVYAIVDESNLQVAESEKAYVDSELYNEADKRKEISYYQDEAYALEEEFNTQMEEYYRNIYSTKADYVYNLRSVLDANVESRTALYTKEQETLGHVVTDKIQQVSSQIEDYKSIQKAPVAGILSYQVDGLETELSLETLENMTYESYNKFLKKSNLQNVLTTYVEKGAPAYKLILESNWYIVSFVKAEVGKNFTEGTSYQLAFDTIGGKSISFKLVQKVEQEEWTRLCFETNDQVGDFLGTRLVSYSIGNKEESGLKIPAQAIIERSTLKIPEDFKVEKDNVEGVYRLVGDMKEFVKISPQYKKDGYIYILQDASDLNAIAVNNVLYNPVDETTYTVSEYEVAQGVYVMNGKLAKFKAVEIYKQSEDYVLIKNNGSSELKEKDKIISNPKNIKIDQFLEEMNIQNE